MRHALMLALALTLLAGAPPARAITDGELDGDGHPYVGLMVAQDAQGNVLGRCSGALLSPRLFLTAGHCTTRAAHVEIWFDADVESGIPGNGYPHTGQARGKPYTHPAYDPNLFFLRDLGAVVLDEQFPLAAYAALPSQNELDSLRPSAQTTFTTVGYGVQTAYPTPADWKESRLRVRMVATPHLVQINTGFSGDFSIMLSDNAATGGTCFGDSGGPTLLGDSNVVAGVNSYVLNWACGGSYGAFRVDRSWSLDWLYGSFGAYLP